MWRMLMEKGYPWLLKSWAFVISTHKLLMEKGYPWLLRSWAFVISTHKLVNILLSY
ncbi:hypothetical protein HN51_044574, partial [Arachis hypogaea]